MLQTNELRKGNRITYAGKEIIVGGIVGNTIHHSNGQFDQNITPVYEPFKGIPLTEEFFLKYKMNKCQKGFSIPMFKIKGEIHFEKYGAFYVCSIYCSTGALIPNDIEYVHQLQNLYFCLTGEELFFYN